MVLSRSLFLFVVFLSFVTFLVCEDKSNADEDDRSLLAKTLFSKDFSEKSGFDVRGFISGSANWNPDKNDAGFNGPVSFQDRADRVQLEQFYFIMERKVNTADWSLGGRADFLYGTDAAFTTSAGFDNEISNQDYYRAAIPQAYLELNLPIGSGVSLKAGHFYTLLGYEVVPAKDNFFHTHSFSMQYAEPFTHWGSLVSFAASENLTVTAGAVRGWDNLSDSADDNLAFLGGATYTISDDTTAVVSVVSGNEGISRNQTAYSAIITHAISDSLSCIFQQDYGRSEGVESTPAAQWYSVNNYLVKSMNDKLSLGARFEWFRDDDGVRVIGLRSGLGGGPADYYNLTLGVNYKFCDFAVLRPEVRYDYQDLKDNSGTKAFGGGEDKDQIVASANLILSY